MGNCQCSHEDRFCKDIEEPLVSVASSEPAFAAVAAALEKNGHDFVAHSISYPNTEHRKSTKSFNKRQSSCAQSVAATPDIGSGDLPTEETRTSLLSDESESFLDCTASFEEKASFRQVSCTSGGYEQLESMSPKSPFYNKRLMAMVGRIASHNGLFVSVDYNSNKYLLKQLGIDTGDTELLHKIHMWMLESPPFDHSRVLGVFLPRSILDEHIDEKSIVRYLSKQKKIEPILSIETNLMPQSKGVQMIDMPPSFDEWLAVAGNYGINGIRVSSVVRQPNVEGITALVQQQFDIAMRIMEKDYLPVLHITVEIKISGKNQTAKDVANAERRKCEEILFDQLLAALGELKAGERVAFNLTLPAKPNTYLALVGHPNTVRVLATPNGYNVANACKALEQNFGLVGCFGNVLMDGMSSEQSEEDFNVIFDTTLQNVYNASIAVPTKEMQTAKVAHTEGFFACLDSTAGDVDKAMERYRLGSRSDYGSDEEVMDKLHEMRSRILSNTKFSGSRVIGVLMSIDTATRQIRGKPSGQYLWEKKQIVPFLKIEHGLQGEKDGVRLLKDIPKLDDLLSILVENGIYGVKACSIIKKPNAVGIQAVVTQQFQLSKKVMEKELVPVLHVEIDSAAEDKLACEELLITILSESLMQLRPEQKVILWLSIPNTPNFYLSLRGHMNVIRIVAVSGGLDRKASCLSLQQNFGTIGGFNRAFVQGMHSAQTKEELTALIDESCEEIFQSSRNVSPKTVQLHKVSKQSGFFAALAHIHSWKTEFNIAATVRAGMSGRFSSDWRGMFERIVTNPQFSSLHVIGVSLAKDHLDTKVLALPIPKYLWEEKQMVTFVKIDVNGMDEESNGVQLMREVDEDEQNNLLEYAANSGCFGTTALSKIRLPNSQGIRAVVDQQLRWAKKVKAKGLVHLMMIFIDKGDAPEKEKCERTLRQILLSSLRDLDRSEAVMLNVILPSTPGLYDCLVSHPNILRVLGSAGSYTVDEACHVLGENAGMVANFGTAMLDGLGTTQSYADFTRAMADTCKKIQQAATPPGRGSAVMSTASRLKSAVQQVKGALGDDAKTEPSVTPPISPSSKKAPKSPRSPKIGTPTNTSPTETPTNTPQNRSLVRGISLTNIGRKLSK